MMRFLMKRISLLFLLLASCASAAKPTTTTSAPAPAQVTTTTIDWPVPEGWRKETIPFPLDFAPSLSYQGKEEIRFAPRFFKQDSPTYFTYTFAFILDHAPAFSTKQFESDVTTYFQGLASAVTKSPSEARLHHATFRSTAGEQQFEQFEGEVQTIDAFNKDHRALALRVKGESRVCGDKRIVLASLSPSDDAAIWTELAKVRASFACQPHP